MIIAEEIDVRKKEPRIMRPREVMKITGEYNVFFLGFVDLFSSDLDLESN